MWIVAPYTCAVVSLQKNSKNIGCDMKRFMVAWATPDACLQTMTCPNAVPCQVDEANFLEIVDRIPGRSTNACMSKTNVPSGENKMLDLLMRLANFANPSVTSPTVALVPAPPMTCGSLMPTPPAPSMPALPNMPKA